MKGVGMGSWLTNYKRSKFLSEEEMGIISPGDWEHFESFYTEEDFRRVASWGMDHVRLPFDQVVIEEYDRPFHYRERGLEYLEKAFEWCRKAGLNVVLNLHHAVGAYCDNHADELFRDPFLQERFIRLWEELERRFPEEDCVFELLNEPPITDAEPWNELAGRTIKRIHAINPARRIMVGSVCWNNPCFLPQLKTYDDDRIVYCFHVYQPMEFTHQRFVAEKNLAIWNRVMPYPGDMERYREYRRYFGLDESDLAGLDRMDIRYLERVFEPAMQFIGNHPNDILCCNEFSVTTSAPLTDRENWTGDVIRLCRKAGMGYAVWTYEHADYDYIHADLLDHKTKQIVSERMLKVIRGQEA